MCIRDSSRPVTRPVARPASTATSNAAQTYRILDVADLTVDGSFGTGGAVCVMCLLSGMNVWAALLLSLIHICGETVAQAAVECIEVRMPE